VKELIEFDQYLPCSNNENGQVLDHIGTINTFSDDAVDETVVH